VGLVCVALSWDGGEGAREFRLLGDREQVKYRAAQMALEMLRRHLLGIAMDEV
jgi:nicotinamide mononucleotide (NMN) deamidase PncC